MSTLTKKVLISALAFDFNIFKPGHKLSFLNFGEEADMQKLHLLAKKGWIVTKIQGPFYICEKQEPENVRYAIDYRKNVDDEYLEIFQLAGWTPVDSVKHIHLYKADENVNKPLLSDRKTRLEFMTQQMNLFFRYTMVSVLIFYYLNLVINYAFNIRNSIFISTMAVIILISLGGVVFTLMPLLGYFARVQKIKKQNI